MDDNLAKQQQDAHFFDDQWMQEQAGLGSPAPISPDFLADANQSLASGPGLDGLDEVTGTKRPSVMPWERSGPGTVPTPGRFLQTDIPLQPVTGLPGDEKPPEVKVVVIRADGRPATPQQQVGLIQQSPDYYSRSPGYGGGGGWRAIWNILMRTPVFVSALVMIGGLVALLIVLWLVKLF